MITSSSSEEFSFPIMMSNPLADLTTSSASNNASSSLSSSSRWRINSSRVFHHQEDHEAIEEEEEEEEEDDDKDDYMEVRSMSEGGFPIYRRKLERASFQSVELEMEERMDYLWEDFNEEEVGKKENVREVQRNREVCILQGRRPTTGSSLLVMGKLFKGLFSFRRKPTQSKIMRQRG